MIDLSRIPAGEGTRRRLQAALERLSHAYIISGPPAPARALADLLVAAYLCSGAEEDRPCLVCPDCRKVRAQIHPDLIRLAPAEGKQGITVEQVRRLRAGAYIRPNEAACKVFLVEEAQTMNDSAQNALLKVLEDGPPYLAFLLLAQSPEQLLPTIRSRCELLSLSALPGEEDGLDEQLRDMAGQLAGLLLDGGELELAEYAAALEKRKWDDDLPAFLDAVEAALAPALRERPGRALPLVEHLRAVRRCVQYHVGTGHLFGWLAAGRPAP